MNNADKYKWYLYDLGLLLKEAAIEAKQNAEKSSEDDRDFNVGMMLGYHRVIGIMQQQASAFNIPLEDLRLEDIEPDRDLT